MKRDVERLIKARTDYLPGLDDGTKKARLARVSYAEFLVKIAGCDSGVLPFFQARPHALYGLGIDAVSARFRLRFVLDLGPQRPGGAQYTAQPSAESPPCV